MLGADDDPAGFEPAPSAGRRGLATDARTSGSAPATGCFEALVPAIIEQKVTGQEAFAGFRRLVHRYGERAPGPGRELRLWVQPGAATLRRIPSWEWLRHAHRPRPLASRRPRRHASPTASSG